MNSLDHIRAQIDAACHKAGRDPKEVTLLGASKTVEVERLVPFFEQGLQDFGENYIQEGIEKVRFFREHNLSATWHFIGSLQSNKAREAVAHFDVIHSLDRLSLAKELDKEARKIGKVQRVLIQVNVGHEDSKAGAEPDSVATLLESCRAFANLSVEGLMSLPPFSDNPEETRPFHTQLRQLREHLATAAQPLPILSMGMSRDFEIAIEEGATHVRIGTALFGTRSYTSQ
ncbi:YggS family pyridoxal phosphate-dependent enzyme [bacterium]|nr:MAG: YggS family pyridoxal phosphate-dependent enzyme [bacterium]